MSMTATTVSARQRHWDLRAAGNFIGGGVGSGTVIATALASVATGAPPRLTMAAGLICILAGLSLILMKIGKPFRALNVFFHPNTSWMTRETIVAVPLLALVFLAALFPHPALAVAAALFAAAFLYCQARILRASKGIPAWRQAEIVPFVAATGLAEGSGLCLVLGGHSTVAVTYALVTALAREAAWHSYRRGLAAAGIPPKVTAPLRTPFFAAVRIAQVVGLLLTAAALAGGEVGTLLAVIGGALAVLTGGTVKAVLVTRCGFAQGAAVVHAPVRGQPAGIVLPARQP